MGYNANRIRVLYTTARNIHDLSQQSSTVFGVCWTLTSLYWERCCNNVHEIFYVGGMHIMYTTAMACRCWSWACFTPYALIYVWFTIYGIHYKTVPLSRLFYCAVKNICLKKGMYLHKHVLQHRVCTMGWWCIVHMQRTGSSQIISEVNIFQSEHNHIKHKKNLKIVIPTWQANMHCYRSFFEQCIFYLP
jgi:hypothetical protein